MNIKDYKIKKAESKELPDFLNLEIICFSGDRIKEKEYRRLLARKNVGVYGVWYVGELIASSVLIFKRHKLKCRIYSLCVKPEYRGLGIANAMLTGVESQASHEGYNCIYLEVSTFNDEAFKVYAAQGYIVTGVYKKYYQDGSDAIRMTKVLLPICKMGKSNE